MRTSLEISSPQFLLGWRVQHGGRSQVDLQFPRLLQSTSKLVRAFGARFISGVLALFGFLSYLYIVSLLKKSSESTCGKSSSSCIEMLINNHDLLIEMLAS